MNERWRAFAARIEALSLRERFMVLAAAVALAGFAVDMAFINPALARRKLLVAAMAQQQTELQAVQTQIQTLETNRGGAGRQVRREELEREIATADDALKQMNNGLVPAQNMRALLQEVLARSPRLQLLSMQTLPAAPLIDKHSKPEKAGDAAPHEGDASNGEGNIFKHGVQITVQGSYADLHDYLARLEKLPWRMLWSRATLNAGDYPHLTLTVVIYTLSLDKAWLVV
jgi:MSHA biogenesis protein MshJ